jgi:hypothetical protein
MRENFLRMAHTLERQVFDKQYYKISSEAEKSANEIEMKVMGVLDLFMRDSSLG